MIRDFIEEDRTLFKTLAEKFYQSDAVLHNIPTENFETTFQVIIDKNPFARGFMFSYDGVLCGYALIAITYSNEVGGLAIWLDEIYIRPDYRKKGLGKEFFHFIHQEYKGKAKRFRLEVSPANDCVMKMYEQFGYKHLEYIQMIRDTE